jgi:hypothetical protein
VHKLVNPVDNPERARTNVTAVRRRPTQSRRSRLLFNDAARNRNGE